MKCFFSFLQFWLVMMTVSVVCFMIIMLILRAVYAPNNILMLFYGFLIIFILSCIWTFSHMYQVFYNKVSFLICSHLFSDLIIWFSETFQEAIAINFAQVMQHQTPPKDCEYNDLGVGDTIIYFFRVQLFGCEFSLIHINNKLIM